MLAVRSRVCVTRLLLGHRKRRFCTEEKNVSEGEASGGNEIVPEKKGSKTLDPELVKEAHGLELVKPVKYGEHGLLLEFPAEDPVAREERNTEIEMKLEEMKAENEQRIQEDARIVEENKKKIEDIFASRGRTGINLEKRPYDSREDEEVSFSPDSLEISDDVLTRTAEHARKYTPEFLETRLMTKGVEGEAFDRDPNLDDLIKIKQKLDEEDRRRKRKGQEMTFDEEIELFLDVPREVKLTDEERSKFHMDLYENIDKYLTEDIEKSTELEEEGNVRPKQESPQKTIDALSSNQRDIASKTTIRYYESFTANGDPDPREKHNRAATTEEALDVFSAKPSYDEFDEFRLRYGMDMYGEKDPLENPFQPLEIEFSADDDDELDVEWYKRIPKQIQADTLRLSGPTQDVLWSLHNKDPKKFTINRLARLFELTTEKVEDVIELKQEEKDMMKAGEYTTNLEWWFIQDVEQYVIDKENRFMELPYTQWMFQDYPDMVENQAFLEVDEINIEKYKVYDRNRIEYEKNQSRPSKEMIDYAAALVPNKRLDVPNVNKGRANYVITDLSQAKKDQFKVYVRQKDGLMRNASVLERSKALQTERPTKKQARTVL